MDQYQPLPELWFVRKVLATNVFISESGSLFRASCVLSLSKKSGTGWYLWSNTPKDPGASPVGS